MTSTSDRSATQEQEEIEGLGDPDDLQTTAYPLDDIMVRSETRAVAEIVSWPGARSNFRAE